MKKIKLSVLVCVLLFLSQSIVAQTREEKKKDIEAQIASTKLCTQAEKKWEKGELAEAEKLFLQSLATYPLDRIFDGGMHALAIHKMKMGDVKGANAEWDLVLKTLQSYSGLVAYFGGTDDWLDSHRYVPVKDIIVGVYEKRAFANSVNGNMRQTIQDFLTIEKIKGLTKHNFAALGLFAIEIGDFETSQRCVDSLKKNFASTKRLDTGPKGLGTDLELTLVHVEASLYLAKGEFDKVIPLCERLESEDKGLNTTWRGQARLMKAEVYAKLDNIEKARFYYSEVVKHVAFNKKDPEVLYIEGLINLKSIEYQAAIKNFTAGADYKSKGIFDDPESRQKYRFFTGRAEAYEGMKDLLKARKDYEAALVYNPDYEPAIIGLARLEGRVITERKTDKTGPEIKILEPTNTRGLKIVSTGKDIMIKGMASDPTGLKTVSINGLSIYAKEAGDFWGTVALVDGINKFEIEATDLAGNITKQTVEIEKASAAEAVTPIIVTEKQGKNFAVFIASQNYDDSTIPSLENPIADAIKLKLILKNNYNFLDENLITLFNPERSDFKKKFLGLSEVIQPEDNLVIFYAGHGIWVDKEKKGYWLLTDAKRNDVNTWLPNKEVLDMIAGLPARHMLLITDACFSGSVFKTRGLGADAPAALKEMDNKISRVAITSGNDTEVPDESVFMKYLVKALSENKEKYLTAQKMFITQIIEAVMTETKTEPRYGTLELAGHVGGDYIFSKK